MKAQVLLIIIFTLTFALFSVFMLLAPIKDKLLRIKDMENVYQAISNSEKGLEASLLDVSKEINLSLAKNVSTFSDTPYCGGLNYDSRSATCTQIIYSPTGTLWQISEKFQDFAFLFTYSINGESKFSFKSSSDGFRGKSIRTIVIGPSPR
jgi:hypothetical protein